MISKKNLCICALSVTSLFIRSYNEDLINFIKDKTKHNLARQLIQSDKDFDPNMLDSDGNPIIFMIAATRNDYLAEDVIRHPKFNPHLKNKKGETILSVFSKNTPMCEKIMGHRNFKNKPQEEAHQFFDKQAVFNDGFAQGYDAALGKSRAMVQNELNATQERIMQALKKQ